MSSLIELEEPYRSKWRKGYLQTHPNGRQYVCLYNSGNDRSLVSYARYLMNVKAGYFLPNNLDADHDDNDKTNDDPENIKPLTRFDNRRKDVVVKQGYIRSETPQHCQECGEKVYSSKIIMFCSKSCASKNKIRKKREEGNPLGGKSLDPSVVSEIRRLGRNKESMYSIAKQLGISRETAAKYCRDL